MRRRVVGRKPSVYNKGWDKVICVASGPSLTAEQGFRVSCSDWKVIAVNNSWLRVPMADVLYACDQHWWKQYHHDVEQGFNGECWTADLWAAHKYGLHLVQTYDNPGLSTQNGVIHSGGNSGYAAVNLAYLFGARRIILVGYDFRRTYGQDHWHGRHVDTLGALPDGEWEITDWVNRFQPLARDLHKRGVRLVNCSLESAIDSVRRSDLDQELAYADEPADAPTTTA